jgi:hypothetical protein
MKVNKILKYIEFIKEEMTDTPETYIKGKLNQLKIAIDKLFDEEATGTEEDEKPETISKGKARDNDRKKKQKLSMADMGVTLDSSEISVYSQTDDTLTVKYSDQEGTYNLLFSINIKDGISKDPNADFSEDDITKLFVKFKKYGIDNIDLIGQTTYNVTVTREDSEFMFTISKKKPQAQAQPTQGQEQPQEQPQAQEEGEKMNLMEFLEFLKSDFDEKHGGTKGLDIETE